MDEFEALVQGWGEKCCLLKLGVPTGAGPCRKTLVPGMPEKLVRGAEEEDGELPDGSMDGNPTGLVETRWEGGLIPSDPVQSSKLLRTWRRLLSTTPFQSDLEMGIPLGRALTRTRLVRICEPTPQTQV